MTRVAGGQDMHQALQPNERIMTLYHSHIYTVLWYYCINDIICGPRLPNDKYAVYVHYNWQKKTIMRTRVSMPRKVCSIYG